MPNAFPESGYKIGTRCVSNLHFRGKELISSPLCQKWNVQCLQVSRFRTAIGYAEHLPEGDEGSRRLASEERDWGPKAKLEVSVWGSGWGDSLTQSGDSFSRLLCDTLSVDGASLSRHGYILPL